MAYGGSKDDVTDDVTWSWKVTDVTPISLSAVISKIARDRDSGVREPSRLPACWFARSAEL